MPGSSLLGSFARLRRRFFWPPGDLLGRCRPGVVDHHLAGNAVFDDHLVQRDLDDARRLRLAGPPGQDLARPDVLPVPDMRAAFTARRQTHPHIVFLAIAIDDGKRQQTRHRAHHMRVEVHRRTSPVTPAHPLRHAHLALQAPHKGGQRRHRPALGPGNAPRAPPGSRRLGALQPQIVGEEMRPQDLGTIRRPGLRRPAGPRTVKQGRRTIRSVGTLCPPPPAGNRGGRDTGLLSGLRIGFNARQAGSKQRLRPLDRRKTH